MNPYSRCYHPDDLAHLSAEAANVDAMTGYLSGTFYGYHPGRRWEYGLAMKVMKEVCAKTVLDVGGASSVLPCLAAVEPTPVDRSVRLGAAVTIVDPCTDGNMQPWVREQERRLQKSLDLRVMDFLDFPAGPLFDAVCCISVMEHVPGDRAFFRHLLSFVRPGGLLVITVDFFPGNGEQKTGGHLRTYTAGSLQSMLAVARVNGFTAYGGEPDWTYRGNFVDHYTFASLILRRA